MLIVDDEPFNLIALEGLLHSFDGLSVKIDKSYNGKEALKKLQDNIELQCH